MKKLISLLLCILLLSGCAETYDGPTESKFVLSRIETTYFGPSAEDSQYQRTEYAYDIYGNQSMELQYQIRSGDEEDEPHLKIVRTHDEHGNCIRQRQYDVSGLFPRKLVDIRYEYDEQGRMTAHHDKLEPQFSWTAVYDDEARTMTCTYPHAVSVSWFDEHGWTIRQETTFENGETSAIINEFRSDGQRISTRYLESGGITLHSYTYDDQGRILTQSERKDGVSTLLFSWEYGEDYEKMTHSDGSYTITDYNPDGTPDDRIVCNADGSLRERTIYRYTEIQVPAEEVSP